ncbi:MAG TPA: glycoside hydrolase domain-containing protein, partial [Phycisphaerae bacterium]|nr:glycoside hydrolase domain-containing protein [Phycisphaerae bacterium]
TSGYPVGTLADQAPGVQVTMDDLPGPMDGVAAVRFRIFNPTDKPVEVKVLAEFTEYQPATIEGKQIEKEVELLTKEQALTVAPGKTAEFKVNEKFARDLGDNVAAMFYRVTQGGKERFRYYSFFKLGYPDKWVKYAPPEAAYPLQTSFNPVRNNLILQADTYYLDDPADAKQVRYRVIREGDKTPVAEGVIDKTAHYYFRRMLQLPDLAGGTYSVATTMTLAGGKKLGPVAGKFKKLDEAKVFAAWWKNKHGNTERVIPPFTAVSRQGNTVTTIGRKYKLSALGLPEEVVSQDQPVLRGARIVAVIGGTEHVIPLGPAPTFIKDLDWRVSFRGEAEGAGVRFKAEGMVEQDGLCLITLTYAPAGREPVQLDALRLEWPIAPDQAECLVCIGSGGNFASHTAMLLPADKQGQLWSTLDTGKGGSMMAVGSFYPQVWVGNERRGFFWWADSDRGWAPDDEIPAHEVIRKGKEVLLRNNIIGTPLLLESAREIKFCYNATPFKPLPKGWRMSLHSEDGTFGGEHKNRNDPKTGKKIDGWCWLNPPSHDPNEWSALWAEYKKLGDERVRTLRPFDPAWSRQRDYVHTSIPLAGWGGLTSDTFTAGYFAPEWGGNTHGPVQRDFVIYLLERAIREGGLRTIYWDILYTSVWSDVQSGFGYELPGGRIQPSYNGLNQRALMMRLRSLMADHGLTPGSIVSHSTNSYPLVVLPWVDALLDGEWAEIKDATKLDWVDHYPIPRIRAMSVSENWGTQISWMSLFHVKDKARQYRLFRGFFDYQRLYDTWTGQDHRYPSDAILEWGLNAPRIEYVPFWRNREITCGDEAVLVSYWKLPGRVLVLAFNYDGKRAKDPVLRLDFKALGLGGGAALATVRELRGVTGQDGWINKETPDPTPTLNAARQTVTVTGLDPHTGRYFGIRADKPAVVENFLHS